TDGRYTSDGEAPTATATGEGCPGRRPLPAPLQLPSPPSRPAHAPPRRLLVLALQQQVDALSDEGRGVPVLRVRDQLSLPAPRRLINAQCDASRLPCHSPSSSACGHDRRLNPIGRSAVLFMENRDDAEAATVTPASSPASSRRMSAIGAKRT